MKMFPRVDTTNPAAVQAEVQSTYLRMFPKGDQTFIPRAFQWTIDSFTGQLEQYQPIDAKYHDLEHTLQGTLCLTRLLCGRFRAGANPPLTDRMFQLAIAAILLHDSGYLKQADDTEGTGAKYTAIHVQRSADFAARLLAGKGFSPAEIQSVRNMICCTGIDADLDAIPFQDILEKACGVALATADLLGQMSAPDYVDKLPVLYSEFAEAAAHGPDHNRFVSSFSSAEDLISRTPAFWEQWVLPRLNDDFLGQYRFLNQPYPDGPNEYVLKVEANMARLKNGDPLSPASAGILTSGSPAELRSPPRE